MMIKKLILSLLVLLSTPLAFATPTAQVGKKYLLKCHSTNSDGERGYSVQWGYMNVFAEVDGVLEVKNKQVYQFNRYTAKFAISMGEETSLRVDMNDPFSSFWSLQMTSGKNLNNQIPYRPVRYLNHVKYNFDIDFGEISFILPKDFPISTINPRTGGHRLEVRNFPAYLILSRIEDHFGATLELNCFAR